MTKHREPGAWLSSGKRTADFLADDLALAAYYSKQ